MNIGIVGLGLIGGSMAKAVKARTRHTVFGANRSPATLQAAMLAGAVDRVLDERTLPLCDFVVISTYPAAAIEYIKANLDRFKPDSIVVDCSGVKRAICGPLHEVVRGRDFTFIGGHPMAGNEHSGFGASDAHLYDRAVMLLTPYDETPIPVRQRARDFFLETGFKRVHFTAPDVHDREIAYTSQLPHIISNAYAKSPTSDGCEDFAAGSYRDLTRVAKLNAPMWAELFLENADNLTRELDGLAGRLRAYSDAIKAGDQAALEAVMREEIK